MHSRATVITHKHSHLVLVLLLLRLVLARILGQGVELVLGLVEHAAPVVARVRQRLDLLAQPLELLLVGRGVLLAVACLL